MNRIAAAGNVARQRLQLIETEPATGLFILSGNVLRGSVAVEVNRANVVPA